MDDKTRDMPMIPTGIDLAHQAIREKYGLGTELTWTDKPPTEPGWYWFLRREGAGFASITKVNVWDFKYGSLVLPSYYDDCRWAGPIPEPKEE